MESRGIITNIAYTSCQIKHKSMKMNKSRALNVTALLSAALLITSCAKPPEPNFEWTPVNAEAGESIQFENLTEEATSYTWNFGDGSSSELEHPAHTFEEAGDYTVTLTATNDAGDGVYSTGLTIYEPTILGFAIVDSLGWDDPSTANPIEGATVALYTDETSWDNFDTPAASLVSDAEGLVLFENVGKVKHWIWVVKEVPEEGGFWLSGGWIEAADLVEHETNIYYVPCDFVIPETGMKGSSARTLFMDSLPSAFKLRK